MLIKIILTAAFNISIIKGKNASLHFSAKHSNFQKNRNPHNIPLPCTT